MEESKSKYNHKFFADYDSKYPQYANNQGKDLLVTMNKSMKIILNN